MKNPKYQIATYLKKSDWYDIKNYLQNHGWKVVNEYNKYDKAIDYDSFTLKKGNEIIYMAWSCHEKGEIRATHKLFMRIQKQLNITFRYEKAQLLRLGTIRSIKVEYRK